MVTSSIITKRRLREFHVLIVRWQQKMNKKVCCTCKVVVLLFWHSRRHGRCSCQSSLICLGRRCHPIWTVRLEEFWFCFYSQCTLAIVSNSMWLWFQTLNDPSCFFLYLWYRRRGRHLWFHFGGSLERVEIATPHLPHLSSMSPFPPLFTRSSSSPFWNSTW